MKQKQEKIWREYIKSFTVEDVIAEYEHPAIFQKKLKDLIDGFSNRYRDVIEVGCETGTTSFILDDSFNKTLIDLNSLAIELAKKAFRKMGRDATFVVADMFNMPFKEKSFDVVFNAGVIEHFNKQERIMALKEYSRILKDDGLMIIAFPNHHSFPYRSAYLVRNYLLLGYKWPYPKEYKIYDMKDEIAASNLILKKRLIISKDSIFNWWNFFEPMKKFLKIVNKFINFEGYLTVLIIHKKNAE